MSWMTDREPMGGEMERLPRQLDAVECRVLGALLEKEQATPEYYPLTLNALLAACRQKSNRDPVMDLEEGEVSGALDRLRQNVLVWRSEGARSDRWRHALERRWGLTPATKAIMTLLLLRGPQTPGELRGRSGRLHRFDSPGAVEEALAELAGGEQPLVRELPRGPGQKENRWAHLVGDTESVEAAQPVAAATPAVHRPPAAAADEVRGSVSTDREDRLQRLETRVEALEKRLAEALGEAP